MQKNNHNTENQITKSVINTTSNKYSTILADPPWSRNQKGHYGAIQHYDLMPLDRIKAMPIKDLVEDNAHLYLWCPNGLLRDALEVIEAWGFTYRCMLVWIKPKMGLGHYARTAHESLMMATRGKAPVKCHSQPSWMFAPYQPPHSHKPEEQYAVIERLSHPPYLELFARRRQPGWDCWGNEIDSDIVIPGYLVPKYSDKVNPADIEQEV